MTKPSTLEGGWNGPRVQVIAPHGQCFRWVNRATLAVCRSLPVHPEQRTCHCTAITDAMCHDKTWRAVVGLPQYPTLLNTQPYKGKPKAP